MYLGIAATGKVFIWTSYLFSGCSVETTKPTARRGAMHRRMFTHALLTSLSGVMFVVGIKHRHRPAVAHGAAAIPHTGAQRESSQGSVFFAKG